MSGYRETETLILEVKNRPVIWDTSFGGIRDKVKLRATAWSEIYTAVFKDFRDKSFADQAKLGKELQTRWKSIRDSYKKDCKKEKKRKMSSVSTRRGFRPRRYIFSELLSFLKKDGMEDRGQYSFSNAVTTTACTTTTSNNNSVHETEENQEIHNNVVIKQEHEEECNVTCPSPLQSVMETEKMDTIPELEPVPEPEPDLEPESEPELEAEPEPELEAEPELEPKPEPEPQSSEPFESGRIPLGNRLTSELTLTEYLDDHRDPDKDFFRSLLPSVKSLNEDQKLDFKTQVLLALRNVKDTPHGRVDGGVTQQTPKPIPNVTYNNRHRQCITAVPSVTTLPCYYHQCQVLPYFHSPHPLVQYHDHTGM